MILNPLTAIDFYKADHRRQYPEGTTKVYSNFTARSNNRSNCEADKVVFFGLQYFIKSFLIESWNTQFFQRNKTEVVNEYKRIMDLSLGKDSIPTDHIEALHDLGYLPIEIKALDEGTLVPIKTPMITITNTDPKFFWLVNYLETIMSCYLWKACTSATTAYQFKKLLTKYAKETGGEEFFTNFQGHDFSFRGMSSYEDAMISGAAHLLSFWGTDTVAAIDFLEEYYYANKNEMVGCSVPATEHSVMCMGGNETEFETFDRLLDLYPSGIVSIVSDTWDFFNVLNIILPKLKDKIMARNGKVVIRPDSGDPQDIICKSLPILWDLFGGVINNDGYMELDSHIGLIYGDSISYHRAKSILAAMKDLGFASTNVVFGIGSYTYQYVTRDTYGFAVKSTYGEIDGKPRIIFKSPATDSGEKKSAKGLIKVNEDLTFIDNCSIDEEKEGALKTRFINSKIFNETDLFKVRDKIHVINKNMSYTRSNS